MKQSFPKRHEVNKNATWDLSAIFKNDEEYKKELNNYQLLTEQFNKNYKGKLKNTSTEVISNSMTDYGNILVLLSKLAHYASLPVETDRTNSKAMLRYQSLKTIDQQCQEQLLFFYYDLLEIDEKKLLAVAEKEEKLANPLRRILSQKENYLGREIEQALFQLEPSVQQFYDIYNNAKLADLTFPDFEVNGVSYPLSFVLYEDLYMYSEDDEIRRTAFDTFSEELANYQHTFASAYYGHVLSEKAQSRLRGFDSVIDYLLYEQEVDRELYDRQIDVIMEQLAPVMQKYIRHLKEMRGLETITYADLKIDLDPDFNQTITFEESENYIKHSMEIMGADYFDRIAPAFSNRWVDWSQNIGKSTGGFCTMVTDVHPYILMSWTGQLSDVYTLTHELGHAGQMIELNKYHTPLEQSMSLYIVEAPSTFNELLLTGYLQSTAKDSRSKRYALTKMISNTYFHNFITHLLEAAYQREVYYLIDQGQAFTAETLSEIKKRVLEKFWGDEVIINHGAELTWMRQPHYYMGLYPYTYSAGLTIATQAYLNIQSGDKHAVEKWNEFLKTAHIPPVEAAKIAGVDITTSAPLENTIDFLNQTIDQIIEYSKILNK